LFTNAKTKLKSIFQFNLKIKPQNPKVNLIIKLKLKTNRWSKKLRSKKEVPKVLHHPLILLFILKITLFFKVKQSLTSIIVRKFKLKTIATIDHKFKNHLLHVKAHNGDPLWSTFKSSIILHII
jgi:hypothetical protein